MKKTQKSTRTLTKAIRRKIFATLFLLAFSRACTVVPLPGIDHTALSQTVTSNSVTNFLSIFSGGRFFSIGIFSLGIVPYINASILMQIIINFVPSLEKLQKEEGASGRQRIIQLTRYIALCWAAVQSFGISLWLRPYVFEWSSQFVVEITLALTTGAMITLWVSEQITEQEIGNGQSLLISTNILSGLPKVIYQEILQVTSVRSFLELILATFVLLGMITGIIFVQEGTKKIPIISARQLAKGNIKTTTSYLPLRLSQGGVMPLLIASTCLSLPSYVTKLTNNQVILYILSLISPNGPNTTVYLMFYFLLILGCNALYTSWILNPEEISKTLVKMESSIPGVRPGKATTYYLQKALSRLTFLGALFLTLLATIPIVMKKTLGVSVFNDLGPTSLLILVGVVLETSRRAKTYLIAKYYDKMID